MQAITKDELKLHLVYAAIADDSRAIGFNRSFYHGGRLERIENDFRTRTDQIEMWKRQPSNFIAAHEHLYGWDVMDRALKGIGPDLPSPEHARYVSAYRDYASTRSLLERALVAPQESVFIPDDLIIRGGAASVAERTGFGGFTTSFQPATFRTLIPQNFATATQTQSRRGR